MKLFFLSNEDGDWIGSAESIGNNEWTAMSMEGATIEDALIALGDDRINSIIAEYEEGDALLSVVPHDAPLVCIYRGYFPHHEGEWFCAQGYAEPRGCEKVGPDVGKPVFLQLEDGKAVEYWPFERKEYSPYDRITQKQKEVEFPEDCESSFSYGD